MEKTWILILAVILFIVITILYWRLTKNYGKKEYGNKLWNQWTTRTYYWHGALLISGALTVSIIYALKWINVVSF